MIEVQIDGAELTAALERLARSGAELRPVLQEAGELLVHTTRPVPRSRGAESSAKDLLAIPGPRVGGLEGWRVHLWHTRFETPSRHGETTMALAESDLEFIRNDIREHLAEWLAEQSLGKPPAVYEIELRERMVRVEEELKHQRELMREGFAQMDKRFEAMREDMEKRFEQVDKRFEQIDKRFEQIDQRFEQVDQRFERIDKRFEQVDRRFDRNDERFDMLIRRQDRQFYWVLGFIATSLGLTLAALRFMV